MLCLSLQKCIEIFTGTGASRNLLVHVLDFNSLISSNDLPKDWQESFKLLAQKISRQLVVQDNLLRSVLHRIVQSRYVLLNRDSTPNIISFSDTRNSPIPSVYTPFYDSHWGQRPSVQGLL
jgi:hypothetical protein